MPEQLHTGRRERVFGDPMIRLPAIVVLCLSFGCATPQPWLARRTGCEEIDSLPAKVVRVERCTEAGFDHRACLLTYGEEGIACVSQYERQRCEGPWDERAHQCMIWTPYDEASWLVEVER